MKNQFKKNITCVLEGLPGSGKTTILDLLSKEFATAPEILLEEKKYKKTNKTKHFFLLNDIAKIMKVKSLGGVTFIDRYFPSTLGYDYIKLIKNQKNEYYDALQEVGYHVKNHLTPDVYFFIKTDIEKSLKRKVHLNKNKIWGEASDLELMNKFYENYFNFLEVNTKVIYLSNNTSIEKIYQQILKTIKEL